mmetsp:Transcript_32350/g.75534  ORF Transcript_32350/g.75534 Transcript_32350/m.75534 type:complete len:223 (+) Transcript_32350:101-769(+)
MARSGRPPPGGGRNSTPATMHCAQAPARTRRVLGRSCAAGPRGSPRSPTRTCTSGRRARTRGSGRCCPAARRTMGPTAASRRSPGRTRPRCTVRTSRLLRRSQRPSTSRPTCTPPRAALSPRRPTCRGSRTRPATHTASSRGHLSTSQKRPARCSTSTQSLPTSAASVSCSTSTRAAPSFARPTRARTWRMAAFCAGCGISRSAGSYSSCSSVPCSSRRPPY